MTGPHETADGTEQRRTPRSHVAVLALLALAAFAVSLVGTHRLYPHLSANNDEAVYVFQSELFARGQASVPLDQETFFQPWMSGPQHGRLVMAFPPTWPAVLAAGRLLTGSPEPAVAMVCAALVVAVYGATRALTGRSRVALLAAATTTASPILVIHAATRLGYLFAVLLEATAIALVARARTGGSGSRRTARLALVAAGAVVAVLLTARPLDAAVLSVALAAFVLATGARTPRAVASVAGWGALGALPVLVAYGVYNAVVNGGPFTLALQAVGGNNELGFGERAIVDGAPTVDATPRMAAGALRLNLWELPFWLWGGLLALPFVAWGSWWLWRTRRPSAVLLGTLSLLVPTAFFFYWGNLLIVNGRLTIGPHYYLALLLPAAVTTGVALDALWRHRAALAWSALAVLTLFTAVHLLPPKLDRARAHTEAVDAEVAAVDAVRPAADEPGAVVILPAGPDGPWILHPRGQFANPPDLDAPLLYAADEGNDNATLADRFPDRTLYRLDRMAAGPAALDRQRPTVTPLAPAEAPAWLLHAEIVNTTGAPVVTAFAGDGVAATRCVLDTASSLNARYPVTWRLDPDGLVPTAGCAAPEAIDPGLLTPDRVVVGASFGTTSDLFATDRAEQRYWAADTVDDRGSPVGVRVLLPAQRVWVGLFGGRQIEGVVADDPALGVDPEPVAAV
ncbi:MAG: hypothetical protein MUF83_14365 [Acidimicrobiales bacterium]|jgi:hypothetical protein|nr:hypothetical protein [Acidimicrobiales bacterium]